MTPHIPDEFSTWLIDGSPFMIAEMMQRADSVANDPERTLGESDCLDDGPFNSAAA